jgi:hypothetical protein
MKQAEAMDKTPSAINTKAPGTDIETHVMALIVTGRHALQTDCLMTLFFWI